MKFLRNISSIIRVSDYDIGAGEWQKIESPKKNIVVWGAGDQNSVNLPIINSLGLKIVAFVDETKGVNSPI